MGLFNIASFLAIEKEHFDKHGFHLHGESHTFDTVSLDQEFHISLHPEETCENDLIQIYLTVPWSGEKQVALLEWFESSDHEDELPEHFYIEFYFDFCLPLLDNPPNLLDVCINLMSRFDGTPIRVNVSATDRIETVTEPARREIHIRADAIVYLKDLLCSDTNDVSLKDDVAPMCDILENLHELTGYVLNYLPRWCSTS